MAFLLRNTCKDVLHNYILPYLTILDLLSIEQLSKDDKRSKIEISQQLIKQYSKLAVRPRNIYILTKGFYDFLLYNSITSANLETVLLVLNSLSLLSYTNQDETFIVKIPNGEHAKYLIHDKSCNLSLIINVWRSKLNGKTTGFHFNKKKASEITFIDNILSGKVAYYDKQGNVISSGVYSHNIKHGLFTSLNNGRVKEKIIEKFNKGEITEKTIFNHDGSVKYKLAKYLNGTLESTYKNAVLIHTKLTIPNKYGTQYIGDITEKHYENGRLVKMTAGYGTHIEYYPSGFEKSYTGSYCYNIQYYDKGEVDDRKYITPSIRYYDGNRYGIKNHRIKYAQGISYDVYGNKVK
jgi:hypothetical protein